MHSKYHLHSHQQPHHIVISQEFSELKYRQFFKRQLIIRYISMSNQIAENQDGGAVSQTNQGKKSEKEIISDVVSPIVSTASDMYIQFGHMVETTLTYFHYYEIVDGISSFIKTQPILNVFITAVLALFFSPVLLFICFMGIGALSVIIPISLFYQTCVLMVKIPTNFLKRFMAASAKSS